MQDQHCSDRQQTAARISKTSSRYSVRFLANHLSRSDVGYRTSKTDPIGATGTGGVWSERNDSRGSVGPRRRNTHTDKKDNGKEENSSASLGKTRISRDFLFVADPAGPQPACDVGMKERR